MFFCFKQKTAYVMRISDWSSDVCSSDLTSLQGGAAGFKSAPAIMSGLARFDQRQTSAHRDERAGPAEHDPRSDQAEAIADGQPGDLERTAVCLDRKSVV